MSAVAVSKLAFGAGCREWVCSVGDVGCEGYLLGWGASDAVWDCHIFQRQLAVFLAPLDAFESVDVSCVSFHPFSYLPFFFHFRISCVARRFTEQK